MKDLNHYLRLPYSVEILPDEGGYVAVVPDLPGCMSSGETIEIALRGLDEAKQLWLEGRIESEEEIPEPTKIEDFSGKFVLRIPRSLHRTLDYEARKQGVSLNQHVLHILSERHYLGGLQGKLETALDRLASEEGWKHSDWSSEGRHPISCRAVRSRSQRAPNLGMLHYIPKPPRSYKGPHRQPDYAEFAHVQS